MFKLFLFGTLAGLLARDQRSATVMHQNRVPAFLAGCMYVATHKLLVIAMLVTKRLFKQSHFLSCTPWIDISKFKSVLNSVTKAN